MKGSTKVLGINYGGHDTSAALMIDGIVVSASKKSGIGELNIVVIFPHVQSTTV